MSPAQRDGLLGGGVGLFALAYIASARAIEDSLLADAVGAGGVPQAAGMVLLLASVALLIKSWFASPARGTVASTTVAQPRPRRLVSAALVAVMLAYALALPLLGYIVSVSLLVPAVALLGGARRILPLALCTALSGLALWALFDLVLKVRMPVGTLFE